MQSMHKNKMQYAKTLKENLLLICGLYARNARYRCDVVGGGRRLMLPPSSLFTTKFLSNSSLFDFPPNSGQCVSPPSQRLEYPCIYKSMGESRIGKKLKLGKVI